MALGALLPQARHQQQGVVDRQAEAEALLPEVDPGLAERLLIETRARAVLGDAAAAELEYGRATARFNQIQGVMP